MEITELIRIMLIVRIIITMFLMTEIMMIGIMGVLVTITIIIKVNMMTRIERRKT